MSLCQCVSLALFPASLSLVVNGCDISAAVPRLSPVIIPGPLQTQEQLPRHGWHRKQTQNQHRPLLQTQEWPSRHGWHRKRHKTTEAIFTDTGAAALPWLAPQTDTETTLAIITDTGMAVSPWLAPGTGITQQRPLLQTQERPPCHGWHLKQKQNQH